MLTVRWDYSLAYFAESNTRQFRMTHDNCTLTTDIKNPGQNLYSLASTNRYNVDSIVRKAVEMWFAESKGVTNTTDAVLKL